VAPGQRGRPRKKPADTPATPDGNGGPGA